MGLDRMKDISFMGSEHIRKIQTTFRRDAGTVLTTGWKQLTVSPQAHISGYGVCCCPGSC